MTAVARGAGEDAVSPAGLVVMDPPRVGAEQPLRLVQLSRLHEPRDLITVGRLALSSSMLAEELRERGVLLFGLLHRCTARVDISIRVGAVGQQQAHELA